jgi:ribosomal protein L40E
MPVKVQCPSCSKVLNAPDAARGKSVKCPGCESKVPVPAGGGAGAKQAKAAKKQDDDDFLGGIDLESAAASGAEICPKCGADLPEECTECPKCGTDPATGQLSAAAKKRKSIKGPNPADFYGAVWKDGWEFIKANFGLAVRTGLIFTAFAFIFSGCAFMAAWCTDRPPKAFWLFCSLLCLLVLPGWQWHVMMEVVVATISKRKLYVSDDIKFDAITCIALGIRSILWMIVASYLPPLIIGPLTWPLAIIHMCMPVSKKAWLWPSMLPAFFRNLGPVLYFWLVSFIGYLPFGIVYAVEFFLISGPFRSTLESMREGGDVLKAATPWIYVSVLVLMLLFAYLTLGFSILFQARANGLLAYYFKEKLDLIVLADEKTYVRKAIPVDKFGKPIKTTGQKVFGAVLSLVIVAVIGGAGYFVYIRVFKGP